MPTKLSRYAEAVLELCAMAALVLVPLFFDVYSARVFEPDKLTLLRSLALVMIVAWAVRALEMGRLQPQDAEGEPRPLSARMRDWLRTPFFLPTLLLVIVYLIATLFSITPATSLWGSYQRLQGTYTTFSYIVLFVIVATTLRRREQVDRLVTVTILASLPVCLYAIIQHNQLDPLPWGGDVTQRVAANMGNAIFVAAYMIMVVPLTVGRIVTSFYAILTEDNLSTFDVIRAAIYILFLMLQGITVFWSGSRGPWLGLIASVWVFALFGLLMLRRSSAGRGVVRLADVLIAVAGVVAANLTALGVVWLLVKLATAIGVLTAADPATLNLVEIGLIVLGFLALGMVLTFALALSKRTWRWVWLAAVIELVFLVAFLGLLNVKNGPLEFVRQGHRIERLATIFETEGGTGKVRTLIWEGAWKLITPHEPLTFPDGTADAWNAVRPLIGYGPESMYVAYNRFYPPDLAHYESRNASPDRSHNETYDSLVITGVLGLCAYLFVFGSVFYYGYRWLGWIGSRRTTWLFAGLWAGGALAGGLGAILIGEPKYLGVAIPAGAIGLALILYVMLYALFRHGIELPAFLLLGGLIGAAGGGLGAVILGMPLLAAAGLAVGIAGGFGLYALSTYAFADFQEPAHEMTFEQQFLLVALVSAVLGHFVEINMGGIAIAATRTLFWAFAGLMFVVGHHWPRARLVAEHVSAPGGAQPTREGSVQGRKRKRRGNVPAPRSYGPAAGMRRWLGPGIALALVLGIILLTMGYELINNTRQPAPTDPADLIWRSLTILPAGQGRTVESTTATTVLILAATLLLGAVLLVCELGRSGAFRDAPGSTLNAFWLILGLAAGVALLFCFMLASTLIGVSLTGGNVSSTDAFVLMFVRISDGLAGLITLYYAVVFTLLFAGAAALLSGWTLPATSLRPAGAAAGVVLLVVALLLIGVTNLNVIKADIVYKQGDGIDKQATAMDTQASQTQLSDQQKQQHLALWKSAVAVYRHAIDLAPNEDYYYLFLGRAYLQYSNVVTTAADQDTQLQTAESELQRAQRINPLNTDHTANLARLYRRWVEYLRARSPVDAARVEEILQKADRSYQTAATVLSPNNAVLWTEWCDLHGRTMRDWQGAVERCTHSIQIDAQYDRTYVTLGDSHLLHANAITGTVPITEVQALLAQAAQAYQSAGDVQTRARNYADSVTNYNSACVIGYQAAQAQLAADNCQRVVDLSLDKLPALRQDTGLWNTYKTLMLANEALGDGCRQAADQACAQDRYQHAVEAGQSALTLSPPAADQTVINMHISALQEKLSAAGGTP